MTDPFDTLALPPTPRAPRARFAADLRTRVVAALGLDADLPTDPDPPTIRLPERKPLMSTTPTSTVDPVVAATVTPYLTASVATATLNWYIDAYGAVEAFRVVGEDGRLGHAEFTIGAARFMLSDEYPEIGVRSPTTLGGSGVALHLTVADVDRSFARAVAAGATSRGEPADQPHGARHGTVVDPYGHRWMLSQPTETFDLDAYRERSEGSGFDVVGAGDDERVTAADRPGTGGGIWAGVFYEDAIAAIRFLADVFGFAEQLVVTGPDERTVVHSQLRWPEGGVVQAGTYDPANVFMHEPGGQSLYVVTAHPHAVWRRSEAAGLEVVRAPESPAHDPDGMGFSVRDPEGNIWSFGTYGLDEGPGPA